MKMLQIRLVLRMFLIEFVFLFGLENLPTPVKMQQLL
jgi:hypothetical protein